MNEATKGWMIGVKTNIHDRKIIHLTIRSRRGIIELLEEPDS